jgi:hypothetical protein
MARHSNLDPDNLPGQEASNAPAGQDVRSLGPSDSSDTGADMAGPGLIDEDLLGLDRGTNEDSEGGHLGAPGNGAGLSELVLGETSDSGGTGERASAGKEEDIRIGNDIAPDRIVSAEEAGLTDSDDTQNADESES